MFARRRVLQMIGLGGAAAPSMLRSASGLIQSGMKSAAVPESGILDDSYGDNARGVGQEITANRPIMPRWRAAQLAMKVPAMRAAAFDTAWRQNRRVYQVDPDLEVYRSFSPMAKITFQRQRNVERHIREISEPDHYEALQPFKDFLNKTIWGRP
jgi:hypothetical protein